MTQTTGRVFQISSGRLRAVALGLGVLAVSVAVIMPPLCRRRQPADQYATGLASGGASLSSSRAGINDTLDHQAVGTGGSMAAFLMAPSLEQASGRKLVRTSSLDLIVTSPQDAAVHIQQIAGNAGGFLVSSQVSGDQTFASAEIVIRVPAERFEEVRGEIRKLAVRVDADRVEAEDVTKDYVDRDARLRNLRAQEEQYLGILKRAASVKDTLEVSEKLDEVRGTIEVQQAEFEALKKQVETVAITVSLRADADTRVFGLQWRPLYRLKVALRDGLEGLADYTATMAAVVFFLPAILLWVATILIGAAVAWRILRWVGRVLFGFGRRTAVSS